MIVLIVCEKYNEVMLQIATLGLAYQQTPQSKSRTGRYTNQLGSIWCKSIGTTCFFTAYMEQNIAAINGPDLPLKVTQVSQWEKRQTNCKAF